MEVNNELVSRIKSLIPILIRRGKISSQEELGAKLGYPNKSYVSQLINGRVNNRHFLMELLEFDKEINPEWLLKGIGSIFKEDKSTQGSTSSLSTQIAVLENENNSLKHENELLKKKIDTLIDELEEYKKNDVQNLDNFFQMLQMMNEKIDENKEQIEDLQNLIKTQQSA